MEQIDDWEGRFVVKLAHGPGYRNLPRLSAVLRDCPSNYRLHSVVPVASGGGYTLHLNVIFEKHHDNSQED